MPNVDGLGAFMIAIWDPPPVDAANPFAAAFRDKNWDSEDEEESA